MYLSLTPRNPRPWSIVWRPTRWHASKSKRLRHRSTLVRRRAAPCDLLSQPAGKFWRQLGIDDESHTMRPSPPRDQSAPRRIRDRPGYLPVRGRDNRLVFQPQTNLRPACLEHPLRGSACRECRDAHRIVADSRLFGWIGRTSCEVHINTSHPCKMEISMFR